MTENDEEELLTPREVAALLKVAKRTVDHWRRQGKLKAVVFSPQCIRYRRSDVKSLETIYRR